MAIWFHNFYSLLVINIPILKMDNEVCDSADQTLSDGFDDLKYGLLQDIRKNAICKKLIQSSPTRREELAMI